jgi:hypothetical protein
MANDLWQMEPAVRVNDGTVKTKPEDGILYGWIGSETKGESATLKVRAGTTDQNDANVCGAASFYYHPDAEH